jgi:hypothetical protein
MSTYKQKLLDKRWLSKRAEILKRDHFVCQHPGCQRTDGLQVHHKDYFPNVDPWDYTDDLLITLCALHHGKELYRKKVEDQLFTAFKVHGFLLSDLLHFATKLHYDPVFTDSLIKILRKDGKRSVLV